MAAAPFVSPAYLTPPDQSSPITSIPDDVLTEILSQLAVFGFEERVGALSVSRRWNRLDTPPFERYLHMIFAPTARRWLEHVKRTRAPGEKVKVDTLVLEELPSAPKSAAQRPPPVRQGWMDDWYWDEMLLDAHNAPVDDDDEYTMSSTLLSKVFDSIQGVRCLRTHNFNFDDFVQIHHPAFYGLKSLWSRYAYGESSGAVPQSPPFSLTHLEVGRLEMSHTILHLDTLFQPSITHLTFLSPYDFSRGILTSFRRLSSLRVLECPGFASELFLPRPTLMPADNPIPPYRLSVPLLRISFFEHTRYTHSCLEELENRATIVGTSEGVRRIEVVTQSSEGPTPPEGFELLRVACSTRAIECVHISERVFNSG